MKIISFNEDEEVIEKILKHLGLWDLKVRPSPKAKLLPQNDFHRLFRLPGSIFCPFLLSGSGTPGTFLYELIAHRTFYSRFHPAIFSSQSELNLKTRR
jgi:hypothetical protein